METPDQLYQKLSNKELGHSILISKSVGLFMSNSKLRLNKQMTEIPDSANSVIVILTY